MIVSKSRSLSLSRCTAAVSSNSNLISTKSILRQISQRFNRIADNRTVNDCNSSSAVFESACTTSSIRTPQRNDNGILYFCVYGSAPNDNRNNYRQCRSFQHNASWKAYPISAPISNIMTQAASSQSSTKSITKNEFTTIRSTHNLCGTNINKTTMISNGNSTTNLVRCFSSRNNRNRKQKQKQKGPLINEHVIRAILQSRSENAEEIQVRLLIDNRAKGSNRSNTTNDDKAESSHEMGDEKQQKQDQPSTVQLVSLAEAISIATDLDVDLIGIALQQSTPVLRAIKYSKFLYQQSTSSSSSTKGSKNKNQSKSKGTTRKEFTFRAGIEMNDLQRKIDNMNSYLQKGYPCMVVITSNRRNLMQDENVLGTMLGRIEDLVGENGKPQGQLKRNAYGNRGNLMFLPNSTKK